MKKILVPTDFSPIADNALKYAIALAAEFKSEICLYHAYYIHKIDYNLDYPEDEQPIKRQAEQKMEQTKRKFQEELKQKGISLQTIVENDFTYSLFKRKAKNYGADLIVMGSKGASGLEKVVFGTVATTALELSKLPVFVVPPRHSFSGLKKIILAIDQAVISEEDLKPLQQLASAFGAGVTVLHVKKILPVSTYQNGGLPLKNIAITHREVPVSGSVNDTIYEFTRKNKGDLLCMIRRDKGFLKSIFQKSVTKTQVFHNNLPVLVIPENQV